MLRRSRPTNERYTRENTCSAGNMAISVTPSRDPSPSRAGASRVPSIHDLGPPPPRAKAKRQAPQKTIDDFWAGFTSKTPGKAFTILPDNVYAKRAAAAAASSNRGEGHGHAVVEGQNAVASYEHAAEACRNKVAKIVRECRRTNQKYRDAHFDIEADLKAWLGHQRTPDCLMGLRDREAHLRPMSVKRVEVGRRSVVVDQMVRADNFCRTSLMSQSF